MFVPEYKIETKAKDQRCVDGVLLYELSMHFAAATNAGRWPTAVGDAVCRAGKSGGVEMPKRMGARY